MMMPTADSEIKSIDVQNENITQNLGKYIFYSSTILLMRYLVS